MQSILPGGFDSRLVESRAMAAIQWCEEKIRDSSQVAFPRRVTRGKRERALKSQVRSLIQAEIAYRRHAARTTIFMI